MTVKIHEVANVINSNASKMERYLPVTLLAHGADIHHLHVTIEARDAYDWDPAALYSDIPESAILGLEAPLWTETVTNIREAELLAFPRDAVWRPGRKWPLPIEHLGGGGASALPTAPSPSATSPARTAGTRST